MIVQDINKELDKYYEEKRRTAERESEERKKRLQRELPAMAETDRLINILGMLIGYAAMKRRPPAKLVENTDNKYLLMSGSELNEEISRLKEIQKEILLKAGYEADYIENTYVCDRCHDMGTVYENGIARPCECRKALFSRKLKEAAGIPPEDVFEKFNIFLYPEKANQSRYGITAPPRMLMEAVYNRCMRFAAEFDSPNTRNMVFVGNAGLGKTFLSSCIMNYLTDRGVTCLYMPATNLFKPFAPGYYEDDNAFEKVDFIMTCELLVIDDLGSEKQTDARYGELLDILNTRALRGRSGKRCKTIITTNLTPANIFSYYGERVASRVLGEYDIVKFAGEDVRLIRKSQ